MPYWAVRPKGRGPEAARIERADSAMDAIDQAFGRGMYWTLDGKPLFEVKNMGRRIRDIQSNKKRLAALNSTQGWDAFTDAPPGHDPEPEDEPGVRHD